MGIENKVTVVEFNTMDNFLEDLGVKPNNKNWQDAVEEEYPDMSVYVDVNLSALIENLTYNGIKEQDVLVMNKQEYGNVVDFFKIKEGNGIYIMMIGAR